MRDPEPKDPDLAFPPKGSNEFIKLRRSFRSLISKPPITSGVKSAKRVSFKAGKGSNSLKEMEEDVSDGNNGDSPRSSPNGSLRILRRWETLTGGGSRSNVEFSFNKFKKLPSLNENRNAIDMDIIMEKLDEVRHVNEDFVMQEGDSVKKRVSFVNVVQGVRGNRNNKLRRILVSIDESRKKRVYMDLLIEEGRSQVILVILKSYGRASFARVVIEIEAESRLVDEIEVYYNSLWKSMKLRVEYPWKPHVCAHCKVFSHVYDMCNSRPVGDAEKFHCIEVRGQRREAGTSRGGFSSRGRGGFGGRGFGDQRFNRGESSKYVPVKKNGNKAIKDGMGSMDSGKINSRKKNMKKHNITDNRFAELIDEYEIKKNLEWESMRQRIELACKKGLHISIKEKNSWDEELRNYFMMKMQEKICDKVYRDELDRIKVLDMRKQCAEVEPFFKTGHIFTIYELETWTNEKLEFYKASIGEEAYMNIFKQVKSDSNESMDDEVVEDLRSRLSLWKTLLEHKIGVGNESWVLLGDFNVILNINENTNGINVRCEGMKEFRECVENIEVEDITMCGLFYTWIQRTRNPKLGILKKLDRVMGNSQFIFVYPASYANFMPYLSSDHYLAILIIPDVIEGLEETHENLNKKNGNFFDKVKFLKIELARVQESLNRDPSCSKLREKEMFYAQAYKDASIDEEKLLRQKTKVEWLKEGDSNTSYFHNVIKGRVSKSRIKVIYNDSRDAFYGNNVAKQFVSHFSNFIGTCDNVCGSLLDRSCLAC
nr:hypothetical protein [Tanacetum cinerariifolium]